MGFISPGVVNLLGFLELRQVLSTYDGDLRDPLWWPQERPVPKYQVNSGQASGDQILHRAVGSFHFLGLELRVQYGGPQPRAAFTVHIN